MVCTVKGYIPRLETGLDLLRIGGLFDLEVHLLIGLHLLHFRFPSPFLFLFSFPFFCYGERQGSGGGVIHTNTRHTHSTRTRAERGPGQEATAHFLFLSPFFFNSSCSGVLATGLGLDHIVEMVCTVNPPCVLVCMYYGESSREAPRGWIRWKDENGMGWDAQGV